MTARSSRLVALSLLLLAAGALAGTVFTQGDCDDACAPTCGDCLSCAPVAHVPTPPTVAAMRTVEPTAPTRFAALPPGPARAIEHVPLQRLA